MFFSGLSYPELDIHNSGSQHAGGRGPLLRRCTERVSIEAYSSGVVEASRGVFLGPSFTALPLLAEAKGLRQL